MYLKCLVCLFTLMFIQPASSQEMQQEDNGQKGVIIEYEREGDKANANKQPPKRNVNQGKEVQLILGGQSEGGIVKRTKLKIQE